MQVLKEALARPGPHTFASEANQRTSLQGYLAEREFIASQNPPGNRPNLGLSTHQRHRCVARHNGEAARCSSGFTPFPGLCSMKSLARRLRSSCELLKGCTGLHCRSVHLTVRRLFKLSTKGTKDQRHLLCANSVRQSDTRSEVSLAGRRGINT